MLQAAFARPHASNQPLLVQKRRTGIPIKTTSVANVNPSKSAELVSMERPTMWQMWSHKRVNQGHLGYVRPSGTPCKHCVASSFCKTSCIQPTPADRQRGKREPFLVQKRRTGIHGKTDNVANVEPQAGVPRTSWQRKAIGNSLQTFVASSSCKTTSKPLKSSYWSVPSRFGGAYQSARTGSFITAVACNFITPKRASWASPPHQTRFRMPDATGNRQKRQISRMGLMISQSASKMVLV